VSFVADIPAAADAEKKKFYFFHDDYFNDERRRFRCRLSDLPGFSYFKIKI
jgi:hypothetical protein